MTDSSQGLFISYYSGGGGVAQPYHFNVSFDGGATQHQLLMDTGSPWLNIGADLLPDGTYEICEPQPTYPAPSYSSDGKTYQGQWVWVSVTVTGGNGASFAVPSIIAFRSTDPSNVSMMGVSTRFGEMDALNVFLNVPAIVDGTYAPGYILDQNGVFFGYDPEFIVPFQQVPVTMALGQRTASAQVTLSAPPDLALPTYTATLPFLMDTGIDYTIVTPNNSGTPPNPPQWQEANPSGGQQFVPGISVTVDLGAQVQWSFNTSQCGTGPTYPVFARLAVPSVYGIVNTGRHFLASYKYLIQLDARAGATSGIMGFLAL